jgi:hypothetical protein
MKSPAIGMTSPDLTQSDDIERDLFRNYSIALKMWSRKFNTADIAAHLKRPEHEVLRWIGHWRELSRQPPISPADADLR